MSKDMLLITETGTVSLVESNIPLRKGCLGTLKGVAADYRNPTRNSRFYSRRLWELVFKLKWVLEALETKTLFGEADHPEDRVESRIHEAAIVLTSYSFNDEEQVLEAEFDILDTPSGRILKTLADYGCKIGISSRGRGNIVTKNGVGYVDESTYVFGGFDAVVLPAVEKARQTFYEGVENKDTSSQISVVESIINQVSACKNKEQLTSINNILESSSILDNSENLVKVIEEKFNEFSSTPANDDSTTIIEGLEKDLAEAYSTISTLENKVEDLSEVNTINEGVEVAYAETVSNLIEEKESLISKISDMTEAMNSKESKISLLSEKLSEANEKLSKSSRLTNSKESQIAELTNKLEESSNSIMVLENKLKDALIDSENVISDMQDDLGQAQDEILKLRSSLSDSLKSYAKSKCSQYGVNPTRIIEGIDRISSVEELDNLVLEEANLRSRLSKLSIARVSTSNLVENHKSISGSEDSSLSSTRAMVMAVKNYKNS